MRLRSGAPAWRFFALFCALVMGLSGCQLTPVTTGRFVGIESLTVSPPQLEAAGAETRLLVRIAGAFQAQVVPGTWTSAELTLTNATLLTASQTKTVSQSGGSSVATAFNALRPGAGYGLAVKLYNGATLVAQGSNTSFSLAAGANTITVSLTAVGGGGGSGPYTMQALAGLFTMPNGRSALNWGMQPSALALDSSSRLYIADSTGAQVYRLEANNTLTRIAGTGAKGYSGDGGAATSAMLNSPDGLGFDPDGNLYISDSAAHVIRKVDTSGNISTFAGTGTEGRATDGQTPASQPLKAPMGLAFNASGDLLIADSGNSQVRFIPKAGGTYFGKSMTAGRIYAVAGNGSFDGQGGQIFPEAGGTATSLALCSPYSVAFGPSGSLYFADYYSSIVFRVTSAGHMARFAAFAPYGYQGDGGPALNARMRSPRAIALDASNNVYISDTGNARVRRVVSGTISTFAGTGTAGYSGDGGPILSAKLSAPGAMAFTSTGDLYLVDGTRVRKISAGIITTVAGTSNYAFSGDGGAVADAQFSYPTEVKADAAGNLYVADSGNIRVRKIDGTTGVVTTFAGSGAYGNGGDGGAATNASFDSPISIAVDSTGAVYVADDYACRIRKISGGTITTAVGTGVDDTGANGTLATSCAVAYPSAVAVDGDDNLYFVDAYAGVVRMVPKVGGSYFGITMTAGRVYTVAGGGASTSEGVVPTSAALGYVAGMGFDASGNFLISDNSNHRIRMVAKTAGTYYGKPMVASRMYTVAGDGTVAVLHGPNGIAVDASNQVFIAEGGKHRIRKLAADGTLTTIAGTGTAGYSGDGGAATSAALSGPTSVALTPGGALVILDSGNKRLRRAVP